jgi:hypothetical protein
MRDIEPRTSRTMAIQAKRTRWVHLRLHPNKVRFLARLLHSKIAFDLRHCKKLESRPDHPGRANLLKKKQAHIESNKEFFFELIESIGMDEYSIDFEE